MKVTSLAISACAMKSWPVKSEPSGELRIEVPLPGGRTQVVNVVIGKDGDGDAVAFVWSKAGEVRAVTDPWALLKLNASLTYGKLAARGNDIVVVHGLYDATAELAEVGKTIYWTARAADECERTTYGARTDVL
jgi:hypothetical protein